MSDLTDLLPDIYTDLRTLAARSLRRERRGHTLQPTALVNEVWLRLAGQERVPVDDRGKLLALASRMIRRILVDHARRRAALKAGGRRRRVTLTEGIAESPDPSVDLLALDEALTNLVRRNERRGRVVELKYFGGLTNEEVAAELDVSLRTVVGDWQVARAWLHRELSQAS